MISKCFTTKFGTFAKFDRHVNHSNKNTLRTIETARRIYGKGNVRVCFKNPVSNCYSKIFVGCYVEMDIRRGSRPAGVRVSV